MPELRLEYRLPSELADNPKNWRKHPEEQTSVLRDVIAEVGWAGACLFNESTGRLIDGHARKKIAGNEPIPVLVGSWTEEQEAKILATLDPLAAMAETDSEALDSLLREVQTGSESIANMLDQMAQDAGLVVGQESPEITEDEPQLDRAEELRKQWGVESGQLWLLGDHRLLCGDSTKAEDVARVMGGEKASIVFTDPPYGVSIGAKNRLLNSFQPSGRNLTDIKDDDMKPDALKAVLLPGFVNIKKVVMADDCTIFMTAPQGGELGMMMMMMMKEAGLQVRHVLIWKKNAPTFSMGRLDYDYQHEPILLTWGKRHKRPMKGKHRTSVWEIDKPRASAEHPTMKPVELYANALLNNSDEGDIQYEPYSGSGTALIAAEQLSRKCRAIEISPVYVAVALQRWADLTGKTPVLAQ